MHLLKEEADTQRLLDREEMKEALDLMFARMAAIDAACAGKFPLYSPGASGQWLASSGGSWMGGFWSGCWWLRARVTESKTDRRKAAELCRRLADRIHADSINRCMIFWYGAALGAHWFSDVHAHQIALEAAGAIAAAYDPLMRCIPLGAEMGGGDDGKQRVAIDTLAPLTQLLGLEKHAHAGRVAQRHTDALLASCLDQEGAFHCEARYGQQRLQPIGRAGTWSRGQAWGMLGLSRAAALWGEPYLSHARLACEYWQRTRSIGLPPHRLDQADGVDDPSAAVIAALAMLALAKQMPDADRWRGVAHRQISTVIRSQYFTKFQDAKEKAAAGAFWGCCYRTRPGVEELVESPWGHFLLMMALCVLRGVIEPDDA